MATVLSLGQVLYDYSMSNATPLHQGTGTRVALSSGDVFWVEGLAPSRVKALCEKAWLEFPSGRIVRVAQIAQLSYGPIPSSEVPEKFEESDG